MAEYSRHLYNSLLTYLKESGINVDNLEHDGTVEFDMDLNCQVKTCVCTFIVTDFDIEMYARFPHTAEPRQYAAVAQFVTRANSGMYGSSMEMNYDDGTITMRGCGMCNDEPISQDRLNALVNTVAANWERYANGLLKVLFGDANPKAVIDQIESEEF